MVRETILNEGGNEVIVVSATEIREEEEEAGGGTGSESMTYTGPAEVLRQDRIRYETARRYESDLETMKGCCLYCRIRAWKKALSDGKVQRAK
ncbi:hypothetical protein N0V84_006680 [Fusarium piperis]|uniref:Uncharacterized protein n=1 Tax=Fusarium piperis TaxID=1435070 RepID=A0A9W8WBN2_9HYPO|nr:hypothetical protein N0V84_006680 [Fusarium piperis]